MRKKKLERCLRQLVGLSKRNGGYITYQTISKVVTVNLNEITMNAVDQIYQHLKSRRIEIVDRLPDEIALQTTSPPVEYQPRYRQRTKRRRQSNKYTQNRYQDDALSVIYLCPEKAIDQLIWCWETTGELDAEYFFNIVAKCGFSQREIKELVEYLGSLGVDYPVSYGHHFYRREEGADKETLH